MNINYCVLVINPGSTSTKIAVFEGEKTLFEEVLRHSSEELQNFARVADQLEFRKKIIMDTLAKNHVMANSLHAVVGRGGLLKPISGGTYLVNSSMLEDLTAAEMGEHASNLGAIIAYEIAHSSKIPAYIVDPVVVDEMQDVARISGMPEIVRLSIFHALNQKAVARKAANQLGKNYTEVNLIVAHLGGGISVGAHQSGKVIDVNNALDGEGPFSPERSGGIPIGTLTKMCFEGKLNYQEIYKRIVGKGGLVAYLGTNDAREVETMISQGNEKATLIYKAMAYQVSKEIGACAVVLKGKVDGIVLTGGIAYSKLLMEWIRDYISFLAPVMIYPGEGEMEALAFGAIRVLKGEESAKAYF